MSVVPRRDAILVLLVGYAPCVGGKSPVYIAREMQMREGRWVIADLRGKGGRPLFDPQPLRHLGSEQDIAVAVNDFLGLWDTRLNDDQTLACGLHDINRGLLKPVQGEDAFDLGGHSVQKPEVATGRG
jgi:hypothetical protein